MLKTVWIRGGLVSQALLLAFLSSTPAIAQEEPQADAPAAPEDSAPSPEAEDSEPASEAEDSEPASEAEEPEPASDTAAEVEEESAEPPPPQYEEESQVEEESEEAVSTGEEADEVILPDLTPPSPFDKGRVVLGVSVGMASSFSEDWLILGLGVGYFLVKGLEGHLDTTFWLIGDPFMATVTPGVRYVLHFVPKVKPYVGGFYRHYFVGTGFDDTNSIGARMGLNIMTGKMSYFGGGAVYEHFLDTNLFNDQDQWYPEIVFAFSF